MAISVRKLLNVTGAAKKPPKPENRRSDTPPDVRSAGIRHK